MERLCRCKAPNTRGDTCISVKPKPCSRCRVGRLCWLPCLKQLMHVPLLPQALAKKPEIMAGGSKSCKLPFPREADNEGNDYVQETQKNFHHSERELKSMQYNSCTRLGPGSLDKGSTRVLGTSSSFKLNNKPRGRCQEGNKSQEPPDP